MNDHNDRRKARKVFFLCSHHYKDEDGWEDTKVLGVYRSRTRAQAAIEELRRQPGFAKFPEGFSIDEYPLDEDHWTEGFDLTQG